MLAFSLAIGSHFIAADHDGRSRRSRVLRARDADRLARLRLETPTSSIERSSTDTSDASDSKGVTMLKDGRVATRLPAQDLKRARAFYADKLGLEPSEERPGGLLYRCAGGEFALFQSAGASPGTFTQMGWTSTISTRRSPSYAVAESFSRRSTCPD